MIRICIWVGFEFQKYGFGRVQFRLTHITRDFAVLFCIKWKSKSGSDFANSDWPEFRSGSSRPEFDSGRVQICLRPNTNFKLHTRYIIARIASLWHLLSNLDLPQAQLTTLHCDNKSVIYTTHNDVFHEHTKYIKVDCRSSST